MWWIERPQLLRGRNEPTPVLGGESKRSRGSANFPIRVTQSPYGVQSQAALRCRAGQMQRELKPACRRKATMHGAMLLRKEVNVYVRSKKRVRDGRMLISFGRHSTAPRRVDIASLG